MSYVYEPGIKWTDPRHRQAVKDGIARGFRPLLDSAERILLRRAVAVGVRAGIVALLQRRSVRKLAAATPAGARDAVLGVDRAALTARFVLSTNELDRHGDRVDPRKIALDNFLRNPITLYQHDPNRPLGSWIDVQVEKNRLLGTVRFSRSSALAAEVFELVAEGTVRGCSISFAPLEEPTPNEAGGCDFGAVELFEASIVSIPANAGALVAGG